MSGRSTSALSHMSSPSRRASACQLRPGRREYSSTPYSFRLPAPPWLSQGHVEPRWSQPGWPRQLYPPPPPPRCASAPVAKASSHGLCRSSRGRPDARNATMAPHAPHNMQHTACHVQHTSCSMQHIACNMQHIAYNMQHTACNVHDVQRSCLGIRHATRDNTATCTIQHAAATCSIQHAAATCTIQHTHSRPYLVDRRQILRPRLRRECEPFGVRPNLSPSADVAGVSPVPAQMWQGRARCAHCACAR